MANKAQFVRTGYHQALARLRLAAHAFTSTDLLGRLSCRKIDGFREVATDNAPMAWLVGGRCKADQFPSRNRATVCPSLLMPYTAIGEPYRRRRHLGCMWRFP
jgi:hypothetical protein